MRTAEVTFLFIATSIIGVLAAPDFAEEETIFLQDQLDHYAKTNPIGLEALRNEIDAALIKNALPDSR